MNKNLTVSFAAVTLVIVASVITYANFINTSEFNFTNLNQPKLVKGVSTKTITPVPSNSIEIGSDVSSTMQSKIIESTLEYEKIITFYKNFFAVEDWYIVEESESDKFYNIELEKHSKRIIITLSKTDTDTTLISIQESF